MTYVDVTPPLLHVHPLSIAFEANATMPMVQADGNDTAAGEVQVMKESNVDSSGLLKRR